MVLDNCGRYEHYNLALKICEKCKELCESIRKSSQRKCSEDLKCKEFRYLLVRSSTIKSTANPGDVTTGGSVVDSVPSDALIAILVVVSFCVGFVAITMLIKYWKRNRRLPAQDKSLDVELAEVEPLTDAVQESMKDNHSESDSGFSPSPNGSNERVCQESGEGMETRPKAIASPTTRQPAEN